MSQPNLEPGDYKSSFRFYEVVGQKVSLRASFKALFQFVRYLTKLHSGQWLNSELTDRGAVIMVTVFGFICAGLMVLSVVWGRDGT